MLKTHGFGLAGEGGLEEGVEGGDDLEVLGAAGFGFGAAVDPVAPAAHDDDVEERDSSPPRPLARCGGCRARWAPTRAASPLATLSRGGRRPLALLEAHYS